MTDRPDPPTVTAAFDDVAQVAQYAKTYAEAGIHNAACRLLAQLRNAIENPPADDLPAMRNALAAVIVDLAEQRQRAEQAEDRLRAATDAYARLKAQADAAEAARARWQERGKQAEAAVAEYQRQIGYLADDVKQAEAERNTAHALLAAASRHLRALCVVGRHDHMGENLGCAACALTARIETALDPVSGAESAQDGRTGLNVAHEPRQAPQGSQERSEPRANGNGS